MESISCSRGRSRCGKPAWIGCIRLDRRGPTAQAFFTGNPGTGQARLLTNFLLPEGAPQSTAQRPSQLEPTVRYEARFPLPPLPAETEIVQQVVDLPPGWRLERKDDGFAANLVIDG